jgi:hypothetical protein
MNIAMLTVTQIVMLTSESKMVNHNGLTGAKLERRTKEPPKLK